MVRTIPAPVQAAMRAEGIDFVGDRAGLDALLDDLQRHSGPRVHGRALPWSTRQREAREGERHGQILADLRRRSRSDRRFAEDLNGLV